MAFTINPDKVYHGAEKVIFAYATGTTGAIAETLKPKSPFRLLEIRLKLNTAGTTAEDFTINLDANAGPTHDINVITKDLSGEAVTSWIRRFGDDDAGKDFDNLDELDFAWPNTENRTYGLTVIYRRN